jgi:hypothetical protein
MKPKIFKKSFMYIVMIEPKVSIYKPFACD